MWLSIEWCHGSNGPSHDATIFRRSKIPIANSLRSRIVVVSWLAAVDLLLSPCRDTARGSGYESDPDVVDVYFE